MSPVTVRIGSPELAARVDAVLEVMRSDAALLERPVVITDTIGGSDTDERIVLVDPADPATWRSALGHRHTTLVDRSDVEHGLPSALRALGVAAPTSVEARADDRALELLDEGWHLVAASPFRLWIRTDVVTWAGESYQLSLHHLQLGETWPVRVLVTDGGETPDGVVDASFVDLPERAQRCIARSARDLRTADVIFATTEPGPTPDGWWEPAPSQWPDIIERLVFGRATITLVGPGGSSDSTVSAAAVDGVVVADGGGQLEAVRFAAAGGRVSLMGVGELEADGTLSFRRVLLPDRRRSRRVPVSGGSVNLVDGSPAVGVREISATGATIDRWVEDGSLVGGEDGVQVSVVAERPDAAFGVRFHRGVHVEFRGQRVEGLDPEAFGRTIRSRVATRAVPVSFDVDGEPVAALWTEIGDPAGAPLLVVVPPTWARTKESAALIAQFVAANFLASPFRIGIVRFDYRNTRGASFVRREHRRPNEEALGFRVGDALADISAAVTYGLQRLGAEARCALVGMSFSGPICLRAAVDDDRIDGLAQVMAGSDLQNLIRMASGGVDVVAELRRGSPGPPLNVLGVLMDPTVSIADAASLDLVSLSSSQDDAAGLAKPLLWVTGVHDGFVDPELVATVVAEAPGDVQTVSVPCGHVPTSSAEIIAAYGPLVAWLRRLAGDESTDLVVPDEEVALQVTAEEFAVAPRTPMPSPSDYWREYMLGDQGMLGYEILALTPEFQEFMAFQVGQLDLRPGSVVADIGSGLGHLILHLPDVGDAGLDVHEMELVPDLLAAALGRPVPSSVRVHPHRFDASADTLPDVLRSCDRVMMSLFLTVLPDAPGFVRRLVSVLPAGAVVVASSARPDADLSMSYTQLMRDVVAGRTAPPSGYGVEEFVESIRGYQSSAAELFRHAEQGDLRLFSGAELAAVLDAAGLEILDERTVGGSLAVVVTARKP